MESNDNGQNPAGQAPVQITGNALKVDELVEVEVTRITEYGAFVKLGDGKKGLIHISQVADSYVKNVNDHLKVGDKVKVRVMAISSDGKIDLTLKTQKESASRTARNPASGGARPRGETRQFNGARRENASSYPDNKPFKASVFEERLKSFLKESEERQTDLKKHVEKKQGK